MWHLHVGLVVCLAANWGNPAHPTESDYADIIQLFQRNQRNKRTVAIIKNRIALHFDISISYLF